MKKASLIVAAFTHYHHSRLVMVGIELLLDDIITRHVRRFSYCCNAASFQGAKAAKYAGRTPLASASVTVKSAGAAAFSRNGHASPHLPLGGHYFDFQESYSPSGHKSPRWRFRCCRVIGSIYYCSISIASPSAAASFAPFRLCLDMRICHYIFVSPCYYAIRCMRAWQERWWLCRIVSLASRTNAYATRPSLPNVALRNTQSSFLQALGVLMDTREHDEMIWR